MIAALLLAVCAQAPGAAPRIADVPERRAFEDGQRALLNDTALLAGHRGLSAYLATDDALRLAEDNFRAMMELPSFRIAQENFEEVLLNDADARAEFRRHIARLARDTRLGEAIAALQAVENGAPRGIAGLPEALAFLRAHPYVALGMTGRPESADRLPEQVRPLREAFRRDNSFQAALGNAWTQVHTQAGAREAVYPWWARAYGTETAVALRYRALEEELAPFPSRALAWENREFAWAAHADTLAWRDYVYGQARRNPVLEPIYFHYLGTLRERADVAAYAEAQFAALYGTVAAWPPEGAPPVLPRWERPESIVQPTAPNEPEQGTPGTPTVTRPTRPTVDRPTAPARPSAPERARPGTTP